MKTLLLQFIGAITALISFPDLSLAQMPDLRTAANFVVFSSVGAVGSTGISNITGNIGTDNGAITGFELPTIINGNIDSGNIVTVQCKADLQAAYDQLFNTAATNSSHVPAFGTDETLFPGVYSIAAAGSVAGNLTLDAQGDSNAVFIFKFGGAFTTGASTTISLINNASSCNIFWIAEGAISMAASTTMKGTLIANNGAVSMGAGGSLEGRLMSTAGAASIYQVSVSNPCANIVLPIELYSFKGYCTGQKIMLEWTTANESNNKYFTIERSTQGVAWQVVGTVTGGINSSSELQYTFKDDISNKDGSLYRLIQTDFDGKQKYGKIIRVKKCGFDESDIISVFPNPTNGKFELLYSGDLEEVHSIDIYNTQGQKLNRPKGFQTNFDMSGHAPGIYFINLNTNSKSIKLKFVVIK